MAHRRARVSVRWQAVLGTSLVVCAALLGSSSAANSAPQGIWREIPPVSRTGHALLYDGARDRLILFGGSDGAALHGDVWTLPLAPGGLWTRLAVSGPLPPARTHCAAVLDSLGDRMVIFGGEARDSLGNGQGLGDTWALSLGGQPTWTQLAVGRPGPAPRVNPASCVDVTTRRMILVGGASPPGSDAWAFDLGADSAWAPLPTLPFNCVSCPLTRPARVLNMCAYDRVHNALMFYGDSLWMLTLSGTPQWRRIGGPPATSMIFDPVRNRLVFVVANSGRVDTEDLPRDMKDYGAGYYNGLLAAGYRPQQITDGPAVYDSARDRLLIVGGTYELTATRWAVSSATWALSFSGTPAWSSLNGDLGGPEPRTPPPLVAFDPIRNTLFLAGMRAEGSYDDREGRRAWLFSPDSQTWRVVADSATTTLGRVDDGVGVWDPVRGRTLVVNRRSGFFYGAGAVVTPPRVLGEPWLVISNGPPATAIDNCVFDPARDRLIELARDLQPSGRDGFQAWALPLNPPGTWTLLGSPLPVTGPVVVDEVGDRLVLFADRDSSGTPASQTWALPLGTPESWQRLAVDNAPPTTFRAQTAIYDPTRYRMVMLGTLSLSDATFSEWELSLGGVPSWSMIRSGGEPPARAGAWAVYDQARNRMLLLGYWDEGMSLWEQDWNDAPAGVEVSVQGVDAAVGRVNVAWRVLGDALAYVIERSAEGGSWTAIARMAPDGIGQVTFEDRAVVPGGRYGYRLRFGSAETLTAAGEVWVTVPTALALAIEPPEPNPAVGVLRVSFTVPTSEPATLAMLDISGRQVLVRSVDHQEPGRHTLQVADRGTLEPGVYFLRLRQGAVVATARVCIIR